MEKIGMSFSDTVCGLHLGLARGLTGGSDVVVDELVVNDPRRALCRLRLRVEGEPQTVAPDDHEGTTETAEHHEESR